MYSAQEGPSRAYSFSFFKAVACEHFHLKEADFLEFHQPGTLFALVIIAVENNNVK